MFDMRGVVFRFSNVVGPHQTHGVAYDFIRRLAQDPARLKIFGDGTQSKPYIHIEDILGAFQLARRLDTAGFSLFNVASDDHLTVREIADLVVERMGLNSVTYEFTGGSRGWKADVPVYRLDSSRIRALGWRNRRNSREAVTAAVDAMLEDLRAGRLASRV
jgi:UDP-glucose 4-epimerase